ncbi:MAG: hypothetical protein AAF317_10415, partial [Pseudomonadota bacterium]
MLHVTDRPLDMTHTLSPGRVHEAMGPGARAFAAHLARALSGPVIWLMQAGARDRLCPQGLSLFFEPARLILVEPPDRLALLQAMEEALRSGAAPLAVAETAHPPDLTESRRLQLAAGTGGGRGLCLIGRPMTNAAETRWECRPILGPATPDARQQWSLL